MTALNTNTRPLRRLEDGRWSGGSRHKVCEYCAITASCSAGAGHAVVCRDTVPALSFQDELGLDEASNTFRVGSAWAGRLRIGDRVGLYNAKKMQIFGYASVTQVEAGPIGRILRDHAHNNHLMLETPRDDAARELCTWLRRNYGPRIINPQSRLTAIYLLRECDEAAAPAPERG